MKCAICENNTTWNESFGGEKFIICPHCYKKLNPNHKTDIHFALCQISIIKKEKGKENKMTCPTEAYDCPYYNSKGGRFNTCTLKNPAIECDDYMAFEDNESEEE